MKHILAITCLSILALGLKADDTLLPGLLGEYFDVGEELSDYPSIEDKKPLFRKIDPKVSVEQTKEGFNGTDLTDYFFVRWTGVLKVPKAGRYKFFTESDDGSRVYVNGQLVVDNGGLHELMEKEGEIELTEGNHEIRIEYFQNENINGAACKISWEGNGLLRQVIQEGALFHKKESK